MSINLSISTDVYPKGLGKPPELLFRNVQNPPLFIFGYCEISGIDLYHTLQWSVSLSSHDSKVARAIPAASQSMSLMRLSHVGPTSSVKQTLTERETSLSSAVGNVEVR